MRPLLIGLALSAVVLQGCSDDPAAGHTDNSPANQLPTGMLSNSAQTDGADARVDMQTVLSQSLPEGVQASLIGANDQQLLLLQLDPEQLEPVLLGAPGEGLSAQQALERHRLQVLIGSGFVSELHSLQPVGLLQLEGATLNPVQSHGYTRILGINDNGMGVVHKEAYQRGLFHSALQVGPGIVEDGKLDISERDLQRPKYFRSFVAVCEDRWLVGVSLTPTHLRTLGQTLLEHFAQQSWQCAEVVNLAGDRQAVALVRTAADVFYHGDPHTYKASLLGFRLKNP